MIELLVVVGIIAILMTILLPAFKNVRDVARGVACLNTYGQISTALNCYTTDFDDYLPGPSFQFPYTPQGLADPGRNNYTVGLNNLYLNRPAVWWKCPVNGDEVYAISSRVFLLNNTGAAWFFGYPDTALPKKLSAVFGDKSPSTIYAQKEACRLTSASYLTIKPPHSGGYSVMYFDGHVITER